jgi:hypothetical protein
MEKADSLSRFAAVVIPFSLITIALAAASLVVATKGPQVNVLAGASTPTPA